MQINMHEAKTHLSRLIQQVLAGEEVIIAKGSQPLVVVHRLPQLAPRVEGRNRGKLTVSADFDAPLTDFAEYQ